MKIFVDKLGKWAYIVFNERETKNQKGARKMKNLSEHILFSAQVFDEATCSKRLLKANETATYKTKTWVFDRFGEVAKLRENKTIEALWY